MDYSDYSFSASTQAAFYKAEAELLRLDTRLAQNPFVRYMREALLAIDATFAVRMRRDVALPVVPLITAYSLVDWKHHGDIAQSVSPRFSDIRFADSDKNAAQEAIRYMQAMEWIMDTATEKSVVTIETVLTLHELLLNGKSNDNRYTGFRKTVFPHKKGFHPNDIPSAVNDLCEFCNTESFSPLGQASAIHHSFERIVPFESMNDRTGLVLAFFSMFKRGVFASGLMLPLCWGASINRDRRRVLKDASRIDSRSDKHLKYREYWAVHNARNTYLSVVIADSLFEAAGSLRAKWRSGKMHIPANSALDRVLDMLLALPVVSTGRASKAIQKSYGATNEAMRQLTKEGIIREVALDGRERVFVCDQSVAMINEFVDGLFKLSEKAELQSTLYGTISWSLETGEDDVEFESIDDFHLPTE